MKFAAVGLLALNATYLRVGGPLGSAIKLPRSLHLNIFTGNDMHVEHFTNPKLRSIGRLYFDGTTRCSPTLVRPDVIMTNAHCVLDDSHHILQTQFEFITGAETEEGGERFQVIPEKTRVLNVDTETDPQNDVAFMTLSRPADPKKYPPIEIVGISAITPKVPTFLTGYIHRPSTILDNMPVTQSCKIVMQNRDARIFFTNCSTTERMSSSALYTLVGDTPKLIGMHKGVATSHHRESDETVDYSLPYASIMIDGARLKDSLLLYTTGNLDYSVGR